MKIKKLSKAFLTVGAVTILLGTTIAFSDADTRNDPVVSLSYFEKKMDELKDYIDERIREDNNEERGNDSVKFEIVQIAAGQSIIGKDGTEIILRGGTEKGAGKASVIASGNDGLTDITEGKDLKSGQEVPLNHLLIVPRDDGRGVLAITDSIYMVKGEYEIR